MTLRDLPALNAALNAMSAVLLGTGFILIRAGRREAHKRAMIAALVSSTLFLSSYLVYHAQVGSVRFRGQGPVRLLYFAILISHTLLADQLNKGGIAITLVPAAELDLAQIRDVIAFVDGDTD